ncbi:M24 family metallopeptidase [Breznakiella homolactica]|uniref:Aminopeptidase P family protein n=1 Tax=Breznakiella homolactica TaxID=2798577 RepID=A0A7T7XR40_9SPIR|nr:Xaa-Pro peptidase family protein [Breznakiella homolactica]QQO10946.1 Xaa-Pro peptidase family protein [Breznakiella homolactica]
MNNSNTIQNRIQALQRVLRDKQMDAAAIYDRENLIYFAGVTDIEGGCLIVPAEGEPKLLCLWLDAKHIREQSGLDTVIPYFFPGENVSLKTAQLLEEQFGSGPRIGFTRYFISLKDYQCLMDKMPGMEVCDIAVDCYKIRSVKDAEEIRLISKAAGFLSEGMQAAFDCLKPGMTEAQVLAEAEYAMRKAGSEGSSFRMQVLRHDRQQLVHPYAGDFVIDDNQPVVIHLGASYKGYTAKMCRTAFLGNAPAETVEMYRFIAELQDIAVRTLVPGVRSSEIFDAVFDAVHKKGYAKMYMEHIGYGVGIRQSEFYPIIGKGLDHEIRENMVVDLLLPTVYDPKAGGPRLTDTLLVTSGEAQFLTRFPREPK